MNDRMKTYLNDVCTVCGKPAHRPMTYAGKSLKCDSCKASTELLRQVTTAVAQAYYKPTRRATLSLPLAVLLKE